MSKIVFVHGMFQNPKSWEGWIARFAASGHECIAPAWPLHAGEPADLRASPSPMLGKLRLKEVISAIETAVGDEHPVIIGHSVGGLIAQILMNRGRVSAAVAINSVAPNRMIDLDLSFFKNAAIIANPLKGDEPVFIDAQTFHGAFANTLDKEQAAAEFARTATHDSRNVFRDCMTSDGHVDFATPHGPLLLIGGEKDEIIPAHLCQKNAKAYDDPASFREFAGRSHYICNERGWEEVADAVLQWLDQPLLRSTSSAPDAALNTVA